MPTFDKLLEDKVIIRVTVPLRRGEFHERKFYAFPLCLDWMRKDVPNMTTGRCQSPLSPKEQLEQRLRQWMSGATIVHERMFNDMLPHDKHVWEMKTADLRLFGWVYQPKAFIALCGGYADDYKEPTKTKNYADDVKAVVAARHLLPLDGPKFATGDFDELV